MPLRIRFFDTLAWRLTVSFAALSLVVGALFVSLVYMALVNSMTRETDGYLADTANELLDIIGKNGLSGRSQTEITEEVATRTYMRTYARVLDSSGKKLLETHGMPAGLAPETFPLPANSAAHVQAVDLNPSLHGRTYRAIAVQLQPPQSGSLQIVCDRRREAGIMKRFRGYLLVSLGLAMLLSAAGVYWIARRSIRPVKQMVSATEQIGQTTLHERLNSAKFPAELRLLAFSFNAMLDRLEESFARLSQFSEDIAHELRTPVNNLRGGMEVVLGKPRSPEDYRDALGSALEECERLARLVDRLLFIARSENSAAPLERDWVELRQELLNTSEFYGVDAEESGVRVSVDAPAGLRLQANRDLLRSLLGNLLSNAIAHTPHGGSIKLSAAALEHCVAVTIADTGKGIPAEHLPYIFNRFYRVDRSRSQTSGGLGLGLAIVGSIAKLHNATLNVSSDVGKGTAIVVKFPAS